MDDLQSCMDISRWLYRVVGKYGAPGPEAPAPEGIEPGALTAEKGYYWESPATPSTPLQYYRIRFEARTAEQGYWAAMSYVGDEILQPDHYGGIDPSDGWTPNEACFRGKVAADRIKLRFYPVRNGPLHVRGPRLSAVPREYAGEWSDAVYAAMPPLEYSPPADRLALLPRTAARLQAGKQVKFVFLGDSVINDFGSAPSDVLIERRRPGARVLAITSTTSGGNCQFFMRKDRVKPFLLDHDPDLVILGGISHKGDVEPIGEVIRQVQSRSDAEFLLTTPAPMPYFDLKVRPDGPPREWDGWGEKLRRFAADQRLAFLDLTALVEQYLARTGRHPLWILRDTHHANARGRQLLARIMERYFAP